MATNKKSHARIAYMPLQTPNPTPDPNINREQWIETVSNGFVSPSKKNKEYYRVILETLWPEGHGIPGPCVEESQIRAAINAYRGTPYVDTFRRVRELQGEEGLLGIVKGGNKYQLIDLTVSTIDDCIIIRDLLSDFTAIDAEMDALAQEMQIVSELTARCIEENSRKAQDQVEFTRQYNGLVKRYDTAKERFDKLEEERRRKMLATTRIDAFITQIRDRSIVLQDFDPKLWIAAIDTVTVNPDGKMVYRLVTGVEMQA